MSTLVKYGLKSCLSLLLTCSVLDITWASDGTANENEDVLPGEMRVGQATKLCEKLVVDECVKVHAQKYCVVKKKMVPACKKIKPKGENEDENILITQGNMKVYQELCRIKTDGLDIELQAQLKAQLMACIAAKRDPSARKTGRPEYACGTKTPIPWCSINSPSWRENILYPDPEKAAKKQRYTDKLTELNGQIDEAKKTKTDHSDLDQQLKEHVLEKSLGQEKEEQKETVICGGQAPQRCSGDTASGTQVELTDRGA